MSVTYIIFFMVGKMLTYDSDINYCKGSNNFHLIHKTKLSDISPEYNINWDNTMNVHNASTYMESLSFLKQSVLHHKDAIIGEILGLDIPGIYKRF